jgi:D-alanyl-D-alanine carboxypeptidase
VLLGLVIERVTGRPLVKELQRRLLRPLGLRDTSLDESPRIPGLAPSAPQNTSWAGASGALVSTARDLARFYHALLSGRVLKSAQLAAMKTTDPVAGDYGLGLFTVPASCGPAWGHNGAVPGFVAHAYASPDGARQVVVLVNGEPQSERAEAAVNRALDAGLCA